MGPWLITLLICVSTTKLYAVWVYAYVIIVLCLPGTSIACKQLFGYIAWSIQRWWIFFGGETSTIPRNKTGSDILLTNDCQQNISLQQVMVPLCHATSSSSPSATKCWIMPFPAQLECTLLFSRKKIFPPTSSFYILTQLDIKYYTVINNTEKWINLTKMTLKSTQLYDR